MFTDKPRLPTIDIDSKMQERVRHFWDLTDAIRALTEERDALIAGELDTIPDGVRIEVPDAEVHLIRTRERLTASAVDMTRIASHLLKPKLACGLAIDLYRKTNEVPDGIEIEKKRGTLSFRKRR